MVYLRRVFNDTFSGFEISLDPDNPMGIIIGAGSYGNGKTTDVTAITFPVLDFNQHVEVRIFDDPDHPIDVMGYADGEHSDGKFCVLLIAYFTIPQNCSDLKTINRITVHGFVNDELYVTPFEGSEPVWEVIG